MLTCEVNQGLCSTVAPRAELCPRWGSASSPSADHLMWTWTYHTDTDLKVDYVLTISVSR